MIVARTSLLSTTSLTHLPLQDILGHIVEFSVDQHGSRFIQHRLDIAGPDVRQKAFDEIVPQHYLALVENVFGNYVSALQTFSAFSLTCFKVVQKLFEHGTGPQKAAMIAAMETHILHLSLHMYGCRVIQKVRLRSFMISLRV